MTVLTAPKIANLLALIAASGIGAVSRLTHVPPSHLRRGAMGLAIGDGHGINLVPYV